MHGNVNVKCPKKFVYYYCISLGRPLYAIRLTFVSTEKKRKSELLTTV
jgi:hypothetical protein